MFGFNICYIWDCNFEVRYVEILLWVLNKDFKYYVIIFKWGLFLKCMFFEYFLYLFGKVFVYL